VSELPLITNHPDWQHGAVHLLQGPVFEHQGERWRRVINGRREIDGYFRQIGLRVMVDAMEGYAYLEQVPEDELRDLPRIIQRRPLSYGATLYGLFLRQELDRALKEDPATLRVKRTLRQIRALVAEFFPASNNESKDRTVASNYLYELGTLGFVRRQSGTGDLNDVEYELTRLLRAKFNPAMAQELIDRIRSHLARKGNTDAQSP